MPANTRTTVNASPNQFVAVVVESMKLIFPHRTIDVAGVCSGCQEYGCDLCSLLHQRISCTIVTIEVTARSARERVPVIIAEAECLQNTLSEEISELMALSEERLTLLQSLHVKIDEEADTAIKKLNEVISSVNENRKACHEKLEAILGEQVHEIQGHVKTLETRMRLVTECVETAQTQTQQQTQTQTQGESEVEVIEAGVKMMREVESLLERAGDVEARTIIDRQQQAIIISKSAMCDYSVSLLGKAFRNPDDYGALKVAAPVLHLADFCITDMEILCVDVNDNQYSTFVCDESSGSVRVFNTITGELQRTIGVDLRAVYGLALLKTPVPLLFVSSHGQHKIFVYNVMSGELVKTIGTLGASQLKEPWGLYVRPSREANPAAVLYVCDHGGHRVQVFDTESGRIVMTIGTGAQGAGDNKINYPTSLALFEGNEVVKDPMLFVVDYGNHRIQCCHADTGTFIKSFGQGDVAGAAAGQLNGPVGVTVCVVDNASDPLLIVSEYNNCRIQIFNVVTGVSLRCVGSEGSDIGQLVSPHGLRAFVVSKDEIVVFVADNENKRVQKFNIALSA